MLVPALLNPLLCLKNGCCSCGDMQQVLPLADDYVAVQAWTKVASDSSFN